MKNENELNDIPNSNLNNDVDKICKINEDKTENNVQKDKKKENIIYSQENINKEKIIYENLGSNEYDQTDTLDNRMKNNEKESTYLDYQTTEEIKEQINKNMNIFKKTDITQGSSYDFIFKIALIGDSGIGKTSILIRFVDDVFKLDTTSTIGVDFKLVSFKIEEKLAKMQIWDTCGSERFKALTSSFIKSCSVFVLVFDLTKQKSFLNLENWIKLIKENVNPKLLCLVGNKADLLDNRQVTLEDAIKFSNKNELKYLETSAKTNFGIEALFKFIAEKLYEDTIKSRKSCNIGNIHRSSERDNKNFNLDMSNNINIKNDKKENDQSSSDSDEETQSKKKKSNLKKKRKCNC